MTNSFRLGQDGIYRCDRFQEFVWQKHGFGTREASPEADITLKQVHSARVWNVNGWKPQHRECEGDALIANHVGTSIGVRTADCVPILLLDCRTRAIAAVHAGWRGTAGEVARATIERMTQDFGAIPKDIFIAIGPCIRGCCYEVGPEVAARFTTWFPQWEVHEKQSRKLNLVDANRRQMEAAGVQSERIFDCELCTACQSGQFFSFRREPENAGRMMASICRLS
ncbi:MAG TPA: peptidoglycan editing factor PgeF [Bryobacteraceae bacterium]|nr:peptidoglycan editing factor PgeF [Bryobacteraceae bacterium]